MQDGIVNWAYYSRVEYVVLLASMYRVDVVLECEYLGLIASRCTV